MAESVKVAVRVRPFNSREKDRNSKCCIEMPNKTMTRIQDPDNPDQPPKEFSFDFSYWSHDGYEVNAEGMCVQTAPNYADQRTVFDDLGQGVLNNAFKGFNCSLFAYGQTGAGKSYSMVGYGPNKGIVPITCDELFKSITENKGKGNIRYEVTFSMLEIYNEQVRDLLTKDNPKGGLQVRQNPKEGSFFVQGLKKVAVGSYIEIEKRTEEGTSNRTVAATQMNATSSRAHTVVTVTFDQISKNDSGQETKKSSTINLVDLAGSERADSTGATGDRLKEGANINKSLSALGNVISALADLSMGKKKVMVPYRDSVLTKLLQNALGGNSKTIMIAALSPADINHDETLGTLRYADRAKKIKNKAVVNENPMDKLVRELREENEKLKKFLESGGVVPMHDVGGGGGSLSAEEKERMRKEMEAEIRANLALNQEAMQSWDEKLANSRSEEVMSDSSSSKCADIPHLVNLNEDPMLSGVVRHFLEGEEITVGRKDADPTPTITLSGLSIQKQHAVLTMKDGEITIKPASPGAKTKVNGMPLPGERVLKHLDRVLFGSNHLYYLVNPSNAEKSEGSPDEVDWNFAQKEMAEATGFHQFGSSLSKEQQLAQEQVLELLPLVGEANAISEELDKHKNFELVLISGAAQGNLTGGTKVMVKMTDLLNGNSWLWDRGKFMNRRYLMQDLYQRFLDGDAALSSIPREEDPFWEPPEDVLVGTANVFLQSLAYALDFDDKLSVTDYKGAEQASLFVNVTPCNQNGKGLDEDYFVDDTQELLGKPYHYKVTVRTADVHNSRFSKGLFVQYKTFDDTEYTKSPIVKDSLSPEFDHSSIFSFPAIREEHLDWFENGCITLMLYAIQEDSLADSRLMKMSTKELRQMDQYKRGDGNAALGKSVSVKSDGNCEVAQLKSEIILLKRHNERLLKKEKRLQALCEEWAKKPAAEQDFGTFHRQVSAAAYHQSGRLRYRVHMLQALLKSQPQTESNGQVKLDGPKKNGASSRACIIM